MEACPKLFNLKGQDGNDMLNDLFPAKDLTDVAAEQKCERLGG